MMRYQELEKIPGEGMSTSHARHVFLRNIHDERYDMTVKYLRNADANLQECVTAIRKEERDQLRKRAAKRKLQSTLRRYREEMINDDSASSNKTGDGTKTPNKRIRRLQGVYEINNRGLLIDSYRTMVKT
jgi:ATPase subunit of ABC transporter with duplicated ATPase domains